MNPDVIQRDGPGKPGRKGDEGKRERGKEGKKERGREHGEMKVRRMGGARRSQEGPGNPRPETWRPGALLSSPGLEPRGSLRLPAQSWPSPGKGNNPYWHTQPNFEDSFTHSKPRDLNLTTVSHI